MRAGERESHGAVIKRCGLPGRCVVAGLAGLGKGQSDVAWAGGFLIVGQVAAGAICGRAFESSTGVAGVAVERGVRSH